METTITITPQISHNHLTALFASYMFAPFIRFSLHAARVKRKREHSTHIYFFWIFDYDKADRLFGNFILATHFTIEQPLENDVEVLPRFFVRCSSSLFT